MAAVRALGKIGDNRAVEPLRKMLRDDNSIDVVVNVAKILGKFGARKAAEDLEYRMQVGDKGLAFDSSKTEHVTERFKLIMAEALIDIGEDQRVPVELQLQVQAIKKLREKLNLDIMTEFSHISYPRINNESIKLAANYLKENGDFNAVFDIKRDTRDAGEPFQGYEIEVEEEVVKISPKTNG